MKRLTFAENLELGKWLQENKEYVESHIASDIVKRVSEELGIGNLHAPRLHVICKQIGIQIARQRSVSPTVVNYAARIEYLERIACRLIQHVESMDPEPLPDDLVEAKRNLCR